MVFIRPSNIPFPTTWRRFPTDKGTLRIQDLTEDMHEEAMALLTRYFMRDEPPCKYIGIQNYPSAVKELQNLWRTPLKENLSLVCVEDNEEQPPRIVGVNVLTVVCKEDKEEPFHTDDKIWAQLFGAVDLVSRGVDIFEKYGVDKYLTAYGLVVDPAWRGCGVGKELLLARMADTNYTTVDFEIFGKVQGVFFRKHTQKKAGDLGLKGWVMNTTRGTVIGQLQGPTFAVTQMKHWLQKEGSPKSRIEKASFKNESPITNCAFKTFEIRK